jgi:hypothetical protein
MQTQAELAELPFWDLPFMLSSSKRHGFRESHLLVAEAIASVFTEQGFATSDWTVQFRATPETFRVRLGDLTPDGFAFARSSFFHNWLKKIDRWTTPANLERLSTSLTEQIVEHRSKST